MKNLTGVAAFLIILTVALGCDSGSPRKPVETPTPTPFTSFADLKNETEELIKFEAGEYTDGDVERYDRALDQLNKITKTDPNFRDTQKLKAPLEKKAKSVRLEVALLGKRPTEIELRSMYNNYLRDRLNDYDSSEYVGYSQAFREYVKGEPYWTSTLRLRAKNAFGAYIVKDVKFYIQGGSVVYAKGL